MSNVLTIKKGLMAAVCVGGLTLTACASSQTSNSRYGSVYDYESGGDCGNECAAVVTPPVTSSRYGSDTVIGGQPVSPGAVYADCSVVSGMNCNTQPVQQPVQIYNQPAPAPVYTQSVQTPAYTGPVSCPAGTAPNGDGTCMQSGDYGYSSSTTQGYTAPTQGYSEPAACPAGTTPNGDGTCMEGSGYDYSSSTISSSSEMGDCPTGTTRAGNGSCMMSEGTDSSVVIYGSGSNTGYQAPTDYKAPTTYLPYRK